MSMQPKSFDARQNMLYPEYELQYKRDYTLKDVALHHHDFYEIYYLISGDVTYTINNRICRVMPGDILIIAPRELHQVYIRSEDAPYERYILWANPEIVKRLSSPQCNLLQSLDPDNAGAVRQLRLQPTDQKHILTLLEMLLSESHENKFGTNLQCESLLTQLLVYINRLAAQEGDYYEAFSTASHLISQVIDYINHHYSENLSLDTLAEQFFVNKYHLSHEFNRQVGTSIYRYIQKKRLQVARQLLSLGDKPNHIYIKCGFRDYAGFYRAFKSEYGYNPRHYIPPAQQKPRKKHTPSE